MTIQGLEACAQIIVICIQIPQHRTTAFGIASQMIT